MATAPLPIPPEARPDTRALVRRGAIQLAVVIVVQVAILLFGSGRPDWIDA